LKTNNADILNKLHEEALNGILTFGVKGWTMDTLCRKCGLAKDTLYRIIGSKEDLVKNALIKEIRKNNQIIIELMNQDKYYFDVFREIITFSSDFVARFSSEMITQVFYEYPTIEKAISDEMEQVFHFYQVFLEEGKKTGQLKENVDTRLFMNIIHACVMQFLKQPETFNAKEDTKVLLDYLIEGIKA
jgi:AcrR family transcriptional regulator